MSLQIIVVGDTTDHGCKVISGSPRHEIDGIPVAIHGSATECGCKLIGSSRADVA